LKFYGLMTGCLPVFFFFFFYGLLLLLLPAARGGQRPAKLDPPDPSHRLPVREISYGRIQILLLLLFFGFQVVHGFYDFGRVSTRPARLFINTIKKKKSNIYYTVYPTVPTPPEPFFSLSQPHGAHLIISLSSLISVPLPHSLSLSVTN
jgi:hypothetical protein